MQALVGCVELVLTAGQVGAGSARQQYIVLARLVHTCAATLGATSLCCDALHLSHLRRKACACTPPARAPPPRQKTPPVERCVRFLGAIAAACPPGDAGDAFVEGLMYKLSSHLDAADRDVRFRAAQALAFVLQALPATAGIDEALAQQLADALRQRLRDKAGVVRVCAARALGRLPAADEVRRWRVRARAGLGERGAELVAPALQSWWHQPLANMMLDIQFCPEPAGHWYAAVQYAFGPLACVGQALMRHPYRWPTMQDGSFADDPATCALLERLGQEKNKDVRVAIVQVRFAARWMRLARAGSVRVDWWHRHTANASRGDCSTYSMAALLSMGSKQRHTTP